MLRPIENEGTIKFSECNRMSAVPQGAFAVLQVRKNFERAYSKEPEEESRDNKTGGFNDKVLQEGIRLCSYRVV